jgi:hypothetical protein
VFYPALKFEEKQIFTKIEGGNADFFLCFHFFSTGDEVNGPTG